MCFSTYIAGVAVELGHVVHEVGRGHSGRRQVVHGHTGGEEALKGKKEREGKGEGGRGGLR